VFVSVDLEQRALDQIAMPVKVRTEADWLVRFRFDGIGFVLERPTHATAQMHRQAVVWGRFKIEAAFSGSAGGCESVGPNATRIGSVGVSG
jgi:hypothetical protein